MLGIAQPIALDQSSPAFRPEPITSAPSIFLPKEHGSWSLVLEPLALGLLVVPSPAGAALVTAAVIGFFARRPLKAALAADATARRQTARATVMLLSALALAGLAESLLLGGLMMHWPLLLAAPLGGLFLYFDAQNESRAAAAELAGSATFCLLPAACATLAGWSWPAALALAAIALARSVPTILTVRSYLRLGRRQATNTRLPVEAGALAVVILGYLAAHRLVPAPAVWLAGLLLFRTLLLVTPLRPVWPAKRIGIMETLLGVVYIGSIALAYLG